MQAVTQNPAEQEPAEQETPAPENETETERTNRLRRKAYGAATTKLREQYRNEFDTLYSQEAQALGIDYTPRLTPEQKAEQQLADLFEQFPHLREKVSEQA